MTVKAQPKAVCRNKEDKQHIHAAYRRQIQEDTPQVLGI